MIHTNRMNWIQCRFHSIDHNSLSNICFLFYSPYCDRSSLFQSSHSSIHSIHQSQIDSLSQNSHFQSQVSQFLSNSQYQIHSNHVNNHIQIVLLHFYYLLHLFSVDSNYSVEWIDQENQHLIHYQSVNHTWTMQFSYLFKWFISVFHLNSFFTQWWNV